MSSAMHTLNVFLIIMVHHAACNPCASPEVISGTSGLFSSFNFPTETPRNSICFWNITVPEGFVVKITFHAFSLSPADTKTDCTNAQGARLRMSDVASTEQARYPFELCGQSIPSPVYTSTNTIQVRLKTPAQHGVTGFNASYESISRDELCPALANLSDASGVITSPFYPRYYPDNQNCMWDIVASNGKHLKLEIEKTTNIQQCNQCNCDYLDIQYGFDSSGNPSEKICKKLTETVTYYSLKDRLRVQFHSDNLQEFIFMGFRAVYTQLESNPRICPKAATLFTASNGKFSSPGYPLDVPSGLDEANKRACTWNITVAAGKRVKLNFTHLNFGTCSSQCDQCTHLDIYDGDSKSSPSLGRFCPESAKEMKVSHGNNVFVEFESGFGNDRGTGFEVQYSETDDPPTDVGDASTTVTTKPTDEQTDKPSDKPTDKPSDKPTFKQAEPPTRAGAIKTGGLLILTILALAASLY